MILKMETLIALAQKDNRGGTRRVLGTYITLNTPEMASSNQIWLSAEGESSLNSQVKRIGEVHYFDSSWSRQLDSKTRYQIRRAEKRGVRVELRRLGSVVPADQINFVISEWKKYRFLPFGYLLATPPINPTLDFSCALLWRGDRLEGFAPLRNLPDGFLVENLYGRGPSLPQGSLPLLIMSLLEYLQSDEQGVKQPKVSLGMIPDENLIPKAFLKLASKFYNFKTLRKSRLQLRPLESTSIYLHYPKNIHRIKLALVLIILLFKD
jgi:hypothetical protein